MSSSTSRFIILPAFYLAIFLALLQPSSCNSSQEYDERIVGGSEVEPGSLPYMVAVYMNVSGEVKYHCGGAVISTHHILTAAHCVSGWYTERFYVVLGGHDLNNPAPTQVIVGVDDIQIHELFYWIDNSAIPVNDVALIRVSEALVFGSGVDVVTLPKQNEDPQVSQMCTVSGWGSTQEGGPVSTILMSTDVPIVDQDTCSEAYRTISASMMCAGYPTGIHDACAGDSGGPLVCDGILHGIVSWGDGCGEPNKYGVYTRVAHFSDWIEKHNYVPK